MYRIPPKNSDLKRLALRRDLLRILFCLLWIALWIVSGILYNINNKHYPATLLVKGWRFFFLCLFATLSGLLLFRMWRLFTRRPLAGRVITSELSHAYTKSDDPNSHSFDFRLRTSVTIQTAKKRKHRISFEQKNGFYLYYREGESLVRFRSLPYPVNTDPSAPHGYLCAACGRIHPTLPDVCEKCGHTVIDPRDLWE